MQRGAKHEFVPCRLAETPMFFGPRAGKAARLSNVSLITNRVWDLTDDVASL